MQDAQNEFCSRLLAVFHVFLSSLSPLAADVLYTDLRVAVRREDSNEIHEEKARSVRAYTVVWLWIAQENK